jgi:hypothetical protein
LYVLALCRLCALSLSEATASGDFRQAQEAVSTLE